MFSLQPVHITVTYGKIRPAVFFVRIVKENAFRVCNKAKYETIRYPSSQVLHCFKTNRWILLIFSDFNMDTFDVMYTEFQ